MLPPVTRKLFHQIGQLIKLGCDHIVLAVQVEKAKKRMQQHKTTTINNNYGVFFKVIIFYRALSFKPSVYMFGQ